MKLAQLFEKAITVNIELNICRAKLRAAKDYFADLDCSYQDVEDYLNEQFRFLLISFSRSPRFNQELDSSNESINACIDGATYYVLNSEIEVLLLSGIEDVVNDSYRFDEFADILLGTLGHELVHRAQLEKSRISKVEQYDPSENLAAYLSDKFEIMAYAHQAVHELSVTLGISFADIAKKLSSHSEQRELLSFSGSLRTYFDEFDKDSPVRKRFLKTMIDYLTQVK